MMVREFLLVLQGRLIFITELYEPIELKEAIVYIMGRHYGNALFRFRKDAENTLVLPR